MGELTFCVDQVTLFMSPHEMDAARRVSKTFNEVISTTALPRYMKEVADFRNFRFYIEIPGHPDMECRFKFRRSKKKFKCQVPDGFLDAFHSVSEANFVVWKKCYTTVYSHTYAAIKKQTKV